MENISEILLKMRANPSFEGDFPEISALINKHAGQYYKTKDGRVTFVKDNLLYYALDGKDTDLSGLTGVYRSSPPNEDERDFISLAMIAGRCVAYKTTHRSEFK